MPTLSSEQVLELKAAFAAMDDNGEGDVSNAELKRMLARLGEPDDDSIVAQLIQVADTCGDGLIDFKELVYAAMI